MKLSEHFTLEEMERSQTAQSLGIPNHAPTQAISNLQNLCQEVLEPLRQWLNETYPLPGKERPIIINSGYRCRALNKAVGGASNSQHMTGEAVDIRTLLPSSLTGRKPASRYHQGVRPAFRNQSKADDTIEAMFDYIEKNLPFDQLILERASKTSNTWWIHVSLCRDYRRNRHQIIRGLVKSR